MQKSISDTLQKKRRKSLSKICYGYWDARNKIDFSLDLKVCREFDDVTSAGKLFHVRAAATVEQGTLGRRQWTVVLAEHPTSKSRMIEGVVDQEFWRLAEERQPGRLVQVHGYASYAQVQRLKSTLQPEFCFADI